MDLNFKVLGEGEPVIILHGLFGMLDNWQTFGRELAEHGYMVFLVDLPNHGRSPHTDNFSYPMMADLLLEWMHGQGMYHSSIMGHSMGGKVAMQVALSNPASVDKLIVVDIAPKAYPPGHETIIDALENAGVNMAESRSDVENQVMVYVHNIGIVRFLMKNLARRKEGGFEWKMNLPLLSEQYDSVTAAVESSSPFNGPALFIRGGKSSYVADSDLSGIRTGFPNAKLVTVTDAGHWVHVDNGEALLSITLDFLAS